MTDPDGQGKWEVRELDHSELVQMRIRLIALETVATALLATATPEQRRAVAEAAENIRARPSSTRHPLTEFAANEVDSLLRRGERD